MQCQFGWGMQSLRRDTSVPDSLPVTAAELARIGHSGAKNSLDTAAAGRTVPFYAGPVLPEGYAAPGKVAGSTSALTRHYLLLGQRTIACVCAIL